MMPPCKTPCILTSCNGHTRKARRHLDWAALVNRGVALSGMFALGLVANGPGQLIQAAMATANPTISFRRLSWW
jgi:hypothetical protein